MAADAEEVEADDAGRVTGPSLVRSTTTSESLLSARGCSVSCVHTNGVTHDMKKLQPTVLDPSDVNHVGFRSGCVAPVYSTCQQRPPIKN